MVVLPWQRGSFLQLLDEGVFLIPSLKLLRLFLQLQQIMQIKGSEGCRDGSSRTGAAEQSSRKLPGSRSLRNLPRTSKQGRNCSVTSQGSSISTRLVSEAMVDTQQSPEEVHQRCPLGEGQHHPE